MRDAFLSHNSADKPEVREIWKLLQAKGLSCWFDEGDLRAGADWLPKLEAGLADSRCCVLFYGASGFGPWHELERQLAQLMAAEAWRGGRRFGIIPVRLPDAPEWRHLALPSFLRLYASVDFSRVNDEGGVDRLFDAITQEAPPPVNLESGGNEPPYKGMKPYLENDASRYFGRNKDVLQVCAFLQSEAQQRFLAIIGASGSGKSSLVHAGVLSRLRAGSFRRETKSWIYVKLRTGQNAWGDLRATLCGTAPFDRLDAYSASSPERWLHEFTMAALTGQPGNPRLILFIDQFEELFTLRPQGEAPRDREMLKGYMDGTWKPLLENLAYAVGQVSGLVSVVVTIRNDFLGPFVTDPAIGPLLNETKLRYPLLPLQEAEVRAVVERPALAADLQIDAALTERAVQDYLLDPSGALPFLQEALHRVWKERKDGRLRYQDYVEFGGLQGAINAHAEEVVEEFHKVDPNNDLLFRQVFVHLVRLADDGGMDTKRRRPVQELPGGAAAQKFALTLTEERYRLLVSDQEGAGAGGTVRHRVEIAHESLISGWEQLDAWLKDKDLRPARLRLRRFEANARSWRSGREDEPGASLLSGKELADAERVGKLLAEEVPELLVTYVQESRRVANREGRRRISLVSLLVLVSLGIGYLSYGHLTSKEQDLRPYANLKRLEGLHDPNAVVVMTGEMLSTWKGDAYVWYRRAKAMLDLDDDRGLQDTLAKWSENVSPPGPLLSLMRGEAALKLNQPEMAAKHLQVYLADKTIIPEERKRIWPKLAAAYAAHGDSDNAVMTYKKWIVEGDNPMARAGLASVYEKSERWQDYEAAKAALLDLFPDSVEAKALQSQQANGEFTQFIEEINRSPYNQDVWLDYLFKLIQANKHDLALKKAREIRDRFGTDSLPLRVGMGYVYLQQGSPIPEELNIVPSAQWGSPKGNGILLVNIATYRKADKRLSSGSGTASDHYTRGRALRLLGQNKLAIEDFKKALELDASLVQARDELEKSEQALVLDGAKQP